MEAREYLGLMKSLTPWERVRNHKGGSQVVGTEDRSFVDGGDGSRVWTYDQWGLHLDFLTSPPHSAVLVHPLCSNLPSPGLPQRSQGLTDWSSDVQDQIFEMASSRADNGERAGGDRSSKRQRLSPSLNEDEESEEEESEEEESEDEESEDEYEGIGVGVGASEDEDDFVDQFTDEQSESSKSSQSVKLQSSDVLDCPTCCEPLNRPIYQCSNGHLACSSCCKKMNKKCSFCRCPIGDMRCIAMEKVIEASIVPCPNAKYGCHETTMYGDQSSHETLCDFARCFCPVPKCNYMGSYADLKRHACAVHSWEEGILHSFVFDTPLIFSMNFGRRNMVIFQEEKEGDLVVVQAFKGSKGVYVTVNCIAPMSPRVRNLSCSLAKLSEFSTMRVGLRLDKIRKVSEQIKHEAADMLIPPKMLSGEHWKMEICIGRENKYTHI